jgi:hypothetical protein
MRCLSCNVALTDFEATRRYSGSGAFVDLCNSCFKDVSGDIPTTERTDLQYEAYDGDND